MFIYSDYTLNNITRVAQLLISIMFLSAIVCVTALPATGQDSSSSQIISWKDGWKGNILQWKELKYNSIDNIIIDHDLKFVCIISNRSMFVYKLNNNFLLGEKVYDTSLEKFGVLGGTWVKNGLVFWCVDGMNTSSNYESYTGNSEEYIQKNSRTIHWDFSTLKTYVIFPTLVSNAISNNTGDYVALFGRGLDIKKEPPSTGDEVDRYYGRFEILNLRTGKVEKEAWVDAWKTYPSHLYRGWPKALSWANDSIFIIIDRLRKINGEDQYVSEKVLASITTNGIITPLSDMDKQIVLEDDPMVFLDNGRIIECSVFDHNRLSVGGSTWISLFTKEGFFKAFYAYDYPGRPDEMRPVAFTPNGSGIIYHSWDTSEESYGKTRGLYVWNLLTRKNYKVGDSYYIDKMFPWVCSKYAAFASIIHENTTAYEYPGIIILNEDKNAIEEREKKLKNE